MNPIMPRGDMSMIRKSIVLVLLTVFLLPGLAVAGATSGFLYDRYQKSKDDNPD
jgi:hypothetical protein